MADLLRRIRRSRAGLSSAPTPAARRRAQRRRRTRRGVVATVLVASVAIGGIAFAATRQSGERYRTAVAGVASVEQTVDAVGTVASASRADAAFSVAGTVATVEVGVGDEVAAGDLLATLDVTSLQDAVEQAESELADAERALEDDLESQTVAAASTTTVSSSAATSTPTSSPTTDPADPADPAGPADPADPADPEVVAAVTAVAAAQTDLLAQYDVAAAALETARASLAASQVACELFLAIGTDTGGADVGGTGDPASAPASDPAAELTVDPSADVATAPAVDPLTDPATSEALAACQTALGVVQTDQTALDAAQATLLDLATALDRAVAEAQRVLAAVPTATDPTATDPTGSDPTGSDQTTRPTTDQATVTTPSTGTPSAGETSVASAEDVLADRAAIDLAEANLEIARAQLAMVNLTSPIAGTVGAVSLAPGDTATASSTSAVVTVLGDVGHTVTTTLSLAVIDIVEVGQTARVTVASTDEVLTGRVSSIGVLNVSDSSTRSYTVVITLDPTQARLFDGASAQVAIAVGGNEETLTVPTSAVHVLAGAATVTVLRDGEPVEVEVATGAVGTELTEIGSGLEAGDVVVLADLAQPLVGDDAETDSGLTGLGDSGATQVEIRGVTRGGAVAPSFTRSGD